LAFGLVRFLRQLPPEVLDVRLRDKPVHGLRPVSDIGKLRPGVRVTSSHFEGSGIERAAASRPSNSLSARLGRRSRAGATAIVAAACGNDLGAAGARAGRLRDRRAAQAVPLPPNSRDAGSRTGPVVTCWTKLPT
jgi:hypothetical protein